MSSKRLRSDILKDYEIDTTCLAIEDAPVGSESAFSFMVIGDTDAGLDLSVGDSFSAEFAQQIIPYLEESRFLLHTGDVAYPIGNYQNYFERFLKPYRWLLTRLPESAFYRRGAVTFRRPFMVVPGNHDCMKAGDGRGWFNKLWSAALRGVCDRLRSLGVDLGYYGGEGGEAYAETFLDDLEQLSPEQLKRHLFKNYSASVPDSYSNHCSKRATACLNYRPGAFTQLPNRYYRFRYGGIDFFALDSNSLNQDSAVEGFDQAQLDWLEDSLITSWKDLSVIGRIVYLHHSPYTTESFHWQQSQTLWVRRHLRSVLSRVATTLDLSPSTKPLLDVVLSGHAHCFEHLQTVQSERGDAGIDWVVCGGSGFDLRRQRREGSDILENVAHGRRSQTEVVARSQLYAGRHLSRTQKQMKEKKLHSFIRIDVRPEQKRMITVCPFLVSYEDGQWQVESAPSFSVGSSSVKSQHLMRA